MAHRGQTLENPASGERITFRQTSANFLEVTELLAPRVMRFGVRYDF